MSNTTMLAKLGALLNTLTAMLNGQPAPACMVIRETNVSGMRFMDGVPVSLYPVVGDEVDVTEIRALYSEYIDVRTMTYWTKVGSTWSSIPYTGQYGAWRPSSLVMSILTGKMWYLDPNNLPHEIDLTSD